MKRIEVAPKPDLSEDAQALLTVLVEAGVVTGDDENRTLKSIQTYVAFQRAHLTYDRGRAALAQLAEYGTVVETGNLG